MSSAPRIRNIKELATLAGVDPATVSRALSDNPLVAEKTRKRIQTLAREHGYMVNQLARRLRTQQSRVIGIVFPLGHDRRQHLSDPFFMAILGYLSDALTESGYDIMLSRVDGDADNWLDGVVDSGLFDGVLLIGQSDQHAAIERVARRFRPIVAWGVQLPGQTHCAIGSDNLMGGRLAGETLIAAGATRIAFMGETSAPEFRQRHEGVTAAMADAGLRQPLLLLPTPIASDAMEAVIVDHIDRHVGAIDGIAAASDLIAMKTLRVLADRGIGVPGQVRIVGFDDLPLASQTVPRLTTVRQDIGNGAAMMVEALFARMNGNDSPSRQMLPTIVRRDTA